MSIYEMIEQLSIYEIIGQIIGIIAVTVTFISYQMKTDKQVLVAQTAATILMFTHYCLLGAISGLVLNGVCLIRNGAFLLKNRKPFSSPFIPYIFAVIVAATGAVTASSEGFMAIFIVVGLAINTVFLAGNAQALRKSILLTSTLVMIYNIYVFSIGGIINEIIAIISSVIGIIRTVKANSQEITDNNDD